MFIRHMCFEACHSGKQANGKYTKNALGRHGAQEIMVCFYQIFLG